MAASSVDEPRGCSDSRMDGRTETLQPVRRKPESMLPKGGKGRTGRPSAELAAAEGSGGYHESGVRERRSWLPTF